MKEQVAKQLLRICSEFSSKPSMSVCRALLEEVTADTPFSTPLSAHQSRRITSIEELLGSEMDLS